MTIRGTIALIYALAAMGVSVLADEGPLGCTKPVEAALFEIADPTIVSVFEIDAPTGHAELDDLPAYVTDDPWTADELQRLAAGRAL